LEDILGIKCIKTRTNSRGRKLLEKDVESYGKREIQKLGWVAEKFVSPMKRSVPDQMVSVPCNDHHPYGLTFFIEFKAPGKKPTELQLKDHKKRREMGYLVFVCDCYEDTDLALTIIWQVQAQGYLSVVHRDMYRNRLMGL
jgi:hypothetical protein